MGSIVKGNDFHNQREQILTKIVKETDLQVWSYTAKPSQKENKLLPYRQKLYDLVQKTKAIPGGKWLITSMPKIKNYADLPHRPDLSYYYVNATLANRSKPAIFGLAMYQKLHESKVTLNTHIDLSSQYASNMRLYEATGVGTCLITDWKKNLHELFELEREVVTYKCADEVIEKFKYLIENYPKMESIAKAGQRKTLNYHNFEERALQLYQIIKKQDLGLY